MLHWWTVRWSQKRPLSTPKTAQIVIWRSCFCFSTSLPHLRLCTWFHHDLSTHRHISILTCRCVVCLFPCLHMARSVALLTTDLTPPVLSISKCMSSLSASLSTHSLIFFDVQGYSWGLPLFWHPQCARHRTNPQYAAKTQRITPIARTGLEVLAKHKIRQFMQTWVALNGDLEHAFGQAAGRPRIDQSLDEYGSHPSAAKTTKKRTLYG